MHCSFVFPESIERPKPSSETLEIEDLSMMLDKIEEEELESPHEGLENNNLPSRAVHERAYKEAIQETLQKLDREKYLHLVVDDKLQTYSPKYNMIVKSINSKRGSSFVYTEYRTLEGIGVFSKVLKQITLLNLK